MESGIFTGQAISFLIRRELKRNHLNKGTGMGTLVYRGYNVGYRANLVVPPTQYTAVVMTASQYADIAALCTAKSLVAGDVFYSVNGTDTTDGALAAARLLVLQGRASTLSLPYDAYQVDVGTASVTYKQDAFLTQDVIPQCQTIDTLIGQQAAATGDSGLISVYTFDQLVSAVANAPANAVIKLADAYFDFTSTLAITKPITILADRSAVFTNRTYAMSGALVSIDIARQTADANVVFKNISFYNLTADKDNIAINNTAVNQKTIVYFMDCTSDITVAGSGLGLKISHTTTSKAIVVRINGKGYHKFTNISFTTANAGDLLECFGMKMALKSTSTDAITLSNGAVASNFTMKVCEAPTAHAIAGGNAAQRYLSSFCITDDGNGTIDLLTVTDITASGTATILP